MKILKSWFYFLGIIHFLGIIQFNDSLYLKHMSILFSCGYFFHIIAEKIYLFLRKKPFKKRKSKNRSSPNYTDFFRFKDSDVKKKCYLNLHERCIYKNDVFYDDMEKRKFCMTCLNNNELLKKNNKSNEVYYNDL